MSLPMIAPGAMPTALRGHAKRDDVKLDMSDLHERQAMGRRGAKQGVAAAGYDAEPVFLFDPLALAVGRGVSALRART
jgi:hypothetical protein